MTTADKLAAVVAKWDYAKFEIEYWEPIIKRKLRAGDLNAIDVAHLRAIFLAGLEAGAELQRAQGRDRRDIEISAGLTAAQQTVDAIMNRLSELQLEIDRAKVQP